MRVLYVLPVPVVLLGLAPLATASWIADFESGGVYENNLSFSSAVSLERTGTVTLTWDLKLKPSVRPRRAPVPGQRGYR